MPNVVVDLPDGGKRLAKAPGDLSTRSFLAVSTSGLHICFTQNMII